MIISKSNEQVKLLGSLKSKKCREKYSKYIIEGIKLVGEIINSGGLEPTEFIVYSEVLLKRANGGEELYNVILNSNYKTMEVSEEIFKYISDTETPQGALVVRNIKESSFEHIFNTINEYATKNKQFLVLDKVTDAGNLGTIIRSAVSFGVDCIICLKGTVDMYSPKVIRSTMGAIEKVDMVYVNETEYVQIVKVLQDNNYDIIGTMLETNKYITDINMSKKVIFVMGNEANGICDSVKNTCRDFIKIPMENIQESLNVAVATSICLYSLYIGR